MNYPISLSFNALPLALLAVLMAFSLPDQAFAQGHESQSPDHSQMDHSQHQGAGQEMEEQEILACSCTILPIAAEGSGTSRLPGNEGSGHDGLMLADGNWMVMAHGYAWGVYTDQSGPRGDNGAFVQSMAMLGADRNTHWGRVRFRAMASLEPLMGAPGYPNLFATGETAGGEPLVDRQHPHDAFMELSARVDVNLSEKAWAYLYGGPVAEPALGPSAFMHRGSAKLNPEAPITHHWFNSTHITYGVVTGGVATRHLQLEASAFRGREPDESRWNIEAPKFDSWSVRATWNPNRHLSLQASTGRMKEPEALHPGEDEHRSTASVHYANGNGLSALLAFSAKDRRPGPTLTAFLAEANWDIDDHHTIFGRIENVKNDELFPDHDEPLHEVPFRVSKFQLGYAYRLPLDDDGVFNLALGGSLAAFAKPAALNTAYGKSPLGATVFAKLSLGH